MLCAVFAVLASVSSVRAETPDPVVPGGEKSECDREWSEWMADEDLAERSILAAHRENLMRDGRTLTIIGSDSGKQIFEDDVERCDNGYVYHVDTYFEKLDSYLVVATFYESATYLLVNRRTAAKTLIIDEPHIDPTGRCFVAVNTGKVSDPGIQIACVDGTAMTYEANWGVFGYQFVEWVGPDRINLSRLPGGKGQWVTYLRRVEGRWHLFESVVMPLGVE